MSLILTHSASAAPSPMIVLDGHCDLVLRIHDRGFNLLDNGSRSHSDLEKWKTGGLNALFFSIWLDPSEYPGERATARANELIDTLERSVAENSSRIQLCDTAAKVRSTVAAGKVAGLIGLEGGCIINNDLKVLAAMRKRGARYMTLTWKGNLAWAGSSQSNNTTMGLTDFGKQVIKEMNRLGIIVDLSHVSDKTFADAIAVSSKPVICSHSNARLLSYHPRNVTDDMLRALAKNGGVIGVNFYGDFLRPTTTGWAIKPGRPDLKNVADQIDHIRDIAGINHVGIGTDYDGGITPATGLENVSKLGDLWAELRKRGYSESDIKKVSGENFMRVIEANER